MAPPKKPAGRRVRTQTRDVGLVAVGSPRKTPPAPHPPGRKLLADTVHQWEEFWATDVAGMVKPADMPALVRLFRMYDLRARLEKIVLKEPLVPGSQGQPRMNPAAAELASLDTRILALEDRFAGSPMARLKLGVTFAEAARSLEDLNRDFDADEDEEEDPRLRAIDTTAT